MEREDGEVKVTPFNMKEELEEGHFDKDGHYLFNKNREVKDNWLDNIDWVKIKQTDDKQPSSSGQFKSLGAESSDSEDEEAEGSKKFNLEDSYRKIFGMMQPKETIKKTLQRLGVRITSAERLRRKRLGILDDNSTKVTELTELANDILTKTGNMDIYQESYENIEKRLKGSADDELLDMYAENFDAKEQTHRLSTATPAEPAVPEKPMLAWEFKWKQDADAEVFGPFATEQMQNWVSDGYFKDGVHVRKVGAEDSKFYSSNRIDFELYL